MANKNSNWPTNQQPDMTPVEMGDLVRVMDMLRKLPEFDRSNPKELQERIDLYFDFCKQYGVRPGVAGLALAVGISRQALWKITKENGKRAEIVIRAKQHIEALTEAFGISGKMNPLVYMYCMSNWFEGYHNTNIVQVEEDTSRLELPNKDEILKRLPGKAVGEKEIDIKIDELLQEDDYD